MTTLEIIKMEFNDPKLLETKLHYIMAHHDYDGDRVRLAQAVDLVVRLNKTSLSLMTGSKRWTPLQVAVISGFRLGVECLIGKGVEPSDQAIKYARIYHPEFLPLLGVHDMTPHEVSEEKRACFEAACPFPVTMPTGSFVYKAPNDFGIVIRKLLLSRDSSDLSIAGSRGSDVALDLRLMHLGANMEEVAERLGFILERTDWCYFPRDHFISNTERGLISGCSGLGEKTTQEQVQQAIERGMSWTTHMRLNAFCHTNHRSFSGILGNTLTNGPCAIYDYQKRFGKTLSESMLYFEGGDMYTVSALGRRVALLGCSHLGINHALCRIGRFFERNVQLYEQEGIQIEYSSRFTNGKIYSLIKESFALGMIKISGEMGVISREVLGRLLTDRLREDAKNLTPLVKPLPFSPTDDLQAYAKNIGRFAYDREVLLNLFHRTLGLPQGCIRFVPEAGYHLDVFMRPGPKGTMLVQNYEMTQRFLCALLENKQLFQLSDKDLEILMRYSRTAGKLHEELKELFFKVSEELQAIAVPIIPVPALFYDESRELQKKPTYHVNFINGVSGYSPKTEKFYYITTGAKVGDHLGTALMDLFSWYMHQLEPNLEVYFVGRNPRDPKDFSEVMHYWNRLGTLASNAGLHCMTMELEIEPHEHLS